MLKNSGQFSLPETEKQVLDFWKKEDVFKKTLEKNKAGKEFVFYEGPPTANGKPGLHHVLARSFKDVIPRFKTMQGYFVPRKGGWDTHGLPVELEVERQLGLKSKKEIEAYGVAAFNAKCRESVWTYKDEWERLTERMGFWLDMERPYITYKNEYISVVWQILREINKKALLFKGHKVVPWCPRCGTALSSHELALGYRSVKENSVYLKFKLLPGQTIGGFTTDENTYILSWTTTPWTLPGNVALAIGEDIQYKAVQKNGEIYILAFELIGSVIGDVEKNIQDISGKDLVGKKYKPLFEVPGIANDKTYAIYPADFVTTTDGTGVVHTAVMYGEDDYNLGVKVGLPQFHTVTEDGKFIDSIPEVGGLQVKTKESDDKIFDYLKARGSFLAIQEYEHDYPFCWRCNSPLLYFARHSWFIRMSALREKLKSENQKIHWIPEHLQEGRFGEWIKEAKDWAISRDRYWGTPLPIWECKKCKTHTLFSDDDFASAKTSGNTYFLARHGESRSNTEQILASFPEKEPLHLTDHGKELIAASIAQIRDKKIDIIFASDITRTKETAELYAATFGCRVVFDPRLREINFGDLNFHSYAEYTKLFESEEDHFIKNPTNGESRNDVRRRVHEFISTLEKEYAGKNILVVSHEDTLWMLESVMHGWTNKETLTARNTNPRGTLFPLGGVHSVVFSAYPRNEIGERDYHKPYIDAIEFSCHTCGETMTRTPEVLDVWFDSGAMPWAQKEFLFTKGTNQIDTSAFPADYISEGIDQTRGWFYTLLAIGVLLNEGTPYKNVISLGLLLDKNGQKMSKTKGNIVDPWDIMERHGADTTRWFFYTVNSPGEMKKFDEKELVKISRQLFLILFNSFAFFDLYAKKPPFTKPLAATHILDKWILARLSESIESITADLENYEVGAAAKTIQGLVDDVSRWYIRRSRKRLQRPTNEEDYEMCSQVLFTVLQEIAKLLAPFTPFFAEGLYKSLGFSDSVHETLWPKNDFFAGDQKIIPFMEEARVIASAGLAKRAELGIKVRQPLQSIKVKSKTLEGAVEFLEIIKEEINVKEVLFDEALADVIELDVAITPALREEGMLRELIRGMQEARQKKGLKPSEKAPHAVFDLQNNEKIKALIEKNKPFLAASGTAATLVFGDLSDPEAISVKLDDGEVKIRY